MLVYGAMSAMLVRPFRLRGWHLRPALAGALTTGLVLGIAISGKFLGAHSVAKVLLGCIAGARCLALFLRGYARPPPTRPVRLAVSFGSFPLEPCCCSVPASAPSATSIQPRTASASTSSRPERSGRRRSGTQKRKRN